jgi:hypothetical protein
MILFLLLPWYAKYERGAYKAKVVAHMNEQEDIHIKYYTVIFLLRPLLD